jgi:hypothetical protein
MKFTPQPRLYQSVRITDYRQASTVFKAFFHFNSLGNGRITPPRKKYYIVFSTEPSMRNDYTTANNESAYRLCLSLSITYYAWSAMHLSMGD